MLCYVSIDVETDGPCPGLNSMVALGAVAYYDGKQVGQFGVNLHPVMGAFPDPDTEKFWTLNPEAWANTLKDRVHPDEATRCFVDWLKTLPGRPVAVCWPSGFDFTFVYWYCHRFVGHCPFVRNSIDLRSYAAGVLHTSFGNINKRGLFKRLGIVSRPHTHVAIEDALEQGELFEGLRNLNESKK